MAVTGTGESYDPYTFDPTGLTPSEVWNDLIYILSRENNANARADTYGLLPENYVLDMNEVDTDVDTTIAIKIRYLNAQGFTIKNLRSSADYMFSLNTNGCSRSVDNKENVCNIIYDLHLENLYGKKLFTQEAGSSTFPPHGNYFYGLIVSGYFTTTGSIIECASPSNTPNDNYSYIWASSSFTNKGCGFNVKVPNGHFIIAHGTDLEIFQDCLIDFTSKSTFGPFLWTNSSKSGLLFKLENSLIQGRTSQLYIAASTTSVINMTIVRTTSSSGYDGTLVINNSPLTIYNLDKIYTASYTYSGIGVTDAQMKDPAYLQSIGFPILE